MKIRYYLKRRGNVSPIYIGLYDSSSTEIISTGQRINVNDWNINERTPKNQNSDIFHAIEKIRAEVVKIRRQMEANDIEVTPVLLKKEYEARRDQKTETRQQADKKVKAEAITVVKLAQRWRDNELFRFRASTQKGTRSAINKFINYLKSAGFSTLERKSLTPAIISGYEKHLLDKKMSDNSHGTLMKRLRWFLKTLDMETGFIKIRTAKKTKISLTVAELERLEAVNVSASVEQQKAKDLFLLGCYTGLRISDLKRINPLNTKDGFITMRLIKNKKDVKIPIIRSCAAILAKYEYKAPKLAEHTLNSCIKQVCDKAKINEPIATETTRAGKVIFKTQSKHKLISSHVAGKTFITLAPTLWGLTPAEIADIVGKDLRTLLNNYFNDQGESGRQKMIAADNRSKMQVV